MKTSADKMLDQDGIISTVKGGKVKPVKIRISKKVTTK